MTFERHRRSRSRGVLETIYEENPPLRPAGFKASCDVEQNPDSCVSSIQRIDMLIDCSKLTSILTLIQR